MMLYTSFFVNDCADHKNFKLDENRWVDIKDYLKKNALECYLKDPEKDSFKIKDMENRKQYLIDYVLPSVGNIKSGDFGEIFTYFFINSEYINNGTVLYGPKKWVWKTSKDTPAPFTDVCFFHAKDIKRPSNADFVISAESKMCATKPSIKENRIQDAIDGANKDRYSRLAQTICWLEAKCEREGNTTSADYIRRFKDAVKNGFNKIFYALAIIDESLFDDQLKKGYNNYSDIKLYLISIKQLKELYEAFFLETIDEC